MRFISILVTSFGVWCSILVLHIANYRSHFCGLSPLEGKMFPMAVVSFVYSEHMCYLRLLQAECNCAIVKEGQVIILVIHLHGQLLGC